MYKLFRKGIEEAGGRPEKIRCDQGSEMTLILWEHAYHNGINITGSGATNQYAESMNHRIRPHIIDFYKRYMCHIERCELSH